MFLRAITNLKSWATIAALVVTCGSACTIESSEELTPTTKPAPTTKAPPTTAPNGKVTPLTQLTPGMCFDELPAAEQAPIAANVLDCAASHLYEVFDARPISEPEPPPGSPYPGDLEVSNQAQTICYAAFEPFMGRKWEESDYSIQTYWPTQNSWVDIGDRTILCATRRAAGSPTMGSVRGTKQ